MPARFRPRPSYAIVAATLALFLCLTGTAWAVNGPAPGINSVGTSDIINQEVKSADIKPLAVGGGKLAANAVTTAKVLDNSLTGADIQDDSLSGGDIDESTLSFFGGPCPTGQFVRNLGGGTLTCGPTDTNTALGLTALAVTSGGFNSAVGQAALTSNTTGIFNSAVGRLALGSNQSGDRNTAVGADALANNNAASLNSALGQNALNANTTGASNVAVGQAAMFQNQTGHSNSAVGQAALNVNESGSSNTAVGQQALSVSTGSNNTALGANAGSNLTTGSSNIYINNTGIATESSTIRIGDNQTEAFLAGVSGTNVTGVPVLVSSSGQLGVGTVTVPVLQYTPSATAPTACGSGTEGATYYDTDLDGPTAPDEGLVSCDGAFWVSVGDGTRFAD